MKNYRPISILPVVSKIIENVMHTQLTDYFTLNKLFTSQQYGYRQGRIYYEANEASASGPHYLGGPHQNFDAGLKVESFIA